MKAPAAGHPLPKGEGCAKNTSDSCPLLWGEGGERSEPGEGSFPFSGGKIPTQLADSTMDLARVLRERREKHHFLPVDRMLLPADERTHI